MHQGTLRSVRFLSVALLIFGCQPKIGDECLTDLDCSQQGDRTCDTTVPDGYCTQADCGPQSCPEKEGICVSFNNTLSTVGACRTTDPASPYRRNFCMAICDESKDCRDGFACLDFSKENAWGAAVIQDDEEKNYGTRACVLAISRPPIEEGRSDQVCTGADRDAGAGGAGGANP